MSDHVLSDLQERFVDHNRAVYCLSTIIPAFVNQYAFDALLPAVEMLTYQAFIDDSHDKLRAEFELWKQRWHAAAEPTKTALDAYTACNASLYPNLSILLQVPVALPVTTATADRSFSTLKRLKTYLLSSMRDERLTSLALIHVHDPRNDPHNPRKRCQKSLTSSL